jgi:HAD superfamily hydrolase (TIGR01509 family)
VTRAVLFDLDGVLADTERLHWAAYRDVLREYGVDVGIEEYRRRFIIHGGGPEYACRTYDLPLTPDELRARKAPRYLRLLHEGVRPRPGARAVLARLRATHRTAIATNAERAEVDFIVDRLGLAPLVDVTIARCDYVRAKPAPDAYLAAAAALGLAPGECVVVEDTPRGMEAGRAAGMSVIAAPNDLTFDADFTGCAHRIESLDDLTAALLG